MNRQLAIEILNGDVLGTKKQTSEAICVAIEALQEQKMGQWIYEPHPNWGKWGIHITRCSECGFSGGAGKWNFCPNCGAKMEVEDEVD